MILKHRMKNLLLIVMLKFRIVLSYKTPRKDVLDAHALELFFLIPSQHILYGHLLHKQTNPV